MKKYFTIIAAALAISSCGGNSNKADDPIGDSGRTVRTETLLANLKTWGDSAVYMIGHEDATVCGIGWEADYDNDSTIHERSDIKSVVNDFPALLAFDLSGIETGSERNLDSVPFQRIRQEVIVHYDRGGLVSLSWTPQDDVQSTALDAMADFLRSLETPYGVRVPIVFRLRGNTTTEQWKAVVGGLKERDVVNTLYAYAPTIALDCDEKQYLSAYPGDDVIDIMGVNCYCDVADADTTQVAQFAMQMDKCLAMVCALAKKHSKVVAVTETGYERIPAEDWWTKTLAPVIQKHPVSYVLLWRNAHNHFGHFFAPYPGQPSSSDFIRFYNDKHTLFLSDVNALYL